MYFYLFMYIYICISCSRVHQVQSMYEYLYILYKTSWLIFRSTAPSSAFRGGFFLLAMKSGWRSTVPSSKYPKDPKEDNNHITQMLHGAGIVVYIQPQNGPNVGQYMSIFHTWSIWVTNYVVCSCTEFFDSCIFFNQHH